MNKVMHNSMILYRGSLKSCNYHCSYCPFSKHPASPREIAQDREQWDDFCRHLCRTAPELGLCGLMIVPYGEVLLYPWYWKGLARISRIEQVEAAGAQTNLSFPLQMAEMFAQEGGRLEKLRLWATFHPEMISTKDFSEKCRQVLDAGISLCAGAVGVPENIPLLRKLRQSLPKEIYLWINQMDGLKRAYTEQEIKELTEIDPFFYRELALIRADSRECEHRIFIEGNGRHRTCNISIALPKGEEWNERKGKLPEPKCSTKVCSCYLAYGGRNHFMNRLLFGSYPLFRIPRHFRAAFFDIDRTLIPEEKRREKEKIPSLTVASLNALAQKGVYLFFATSLPIEEARKRCKTVWDFFCGGVFSGGGHILLLEKKTEQTRNLQTIKQELLFPVEDEFLTELKEKIHGFPIHLLTDRKDRKTVKITLVRPEATPWKKEETKRLWKLLSQDKKKNIRYFAEENCLQFVSVHAGKANGVKQLCKWTGIDLSEAAVAGDGEEDREMLEICKISVSPFS